MASTIDQQPTLVDAFDSEEDSLERENSFKEKNYPKGLRGGGACFDCLACLCFCCALEEIACFECCRDC